MKIIGNILIVILTIFITVVTVFATQQLPDTIIYEKQENPKTLLITLRNYQ